MRWSDQNCIMSVFLATFKFTYSVSSLRTSSDHTAPPSNFSILVFFNDEGCSFATVLCGTGILSHLPIPIPSHSSVTIPNPLLKLHVVHSHSHGNPMGKWEMGIPILNKHLYPRSPPMNLNQILWYDRTLANNQSSRFCHGTDPDPGLDPGWIFSTSLT